MAIDTALPAARSPSGIHWPRGPFDLADAEGTREIGRWTWLLLAGALLMAASVADRWLPQNMVDLAVSLGLGETIADARVDRYYCGPYERRTFLEQAQRGIRHECRVEVRGSIRMDYDFRTLASTGPGSGRVARVLGRVGTDWPAKVLLDRWLGHLVPLVIAVLIATIALVLMRQAGSLRRLGGPEARMIDADLLDRRMLAKGAVWRFAYDGRNGRRRIGRQRVTADPVIADGVVTRGAVIVAPGTKARLVTRSLLELPRDTGEAVYRGFHADRAAGVAAPDALLREFATGAERDYARAWLGAWRAADVDSINRYIEDRHAAARRLPARRVDALLQRCRALR